jgi:hypothetical protein
VDEPSDLTETPGRPDGEPPARRWLRRFQLLDPWSQAGLALEAVVVLGAVVFVLAQLGPGMLTADTTPAGGDMGAHVWGPAYLRDHLLSDGRLAGWSPDWYAGFPAYQFYMVLPALLIVALDAGWSGWMALVPLLAGLGLVALSLVHDDRRVRRTALVVGLAVIVLGCGLPYGVAFKWVTVSGALALPVCVYVAARLADLPFPGPPLLSIASVFYLFNKQPAENSTGNIIGGNLTSTLAGEFSFSISLAFLVLYVGFLLRGLRRGGYRATTAVLLGLTALCHVIPAIYGIVFTAIALLVSWPLTRERLRWFLPIAPVALAISAFWTGPFVLRRAYLNDMGWEKIPAGITAVPLRDFLWTFWWDDARYGELRRSILDVLFPSQIHWVFALAAVGIVVSFLVRIRLGVLLSVVAVVTVVLFVVTPQGRLWNARLLPLFLLCIFLLAGLAVGELGRAMSTLLTRFPERRVGPVAFATPAVAALLGVAYLSLALGILPWAENVAGAETWRGFSVSSEDRYVVRDWARWNYDGYERKAAYPEYHGLVQMMEGVADDPELGCGRAMWEYEHDRLNAYGTPMAPMLLPFWTDGCIGSMEGLYFEASATTPYHFLNQRALSANCSCAQRDLPYGSGFDIDLGVQQLQLMGVRYYLAFSDTAVAAASSHPDLREVASTDVWHAYLVADSELVAPLENEPVVLTGVEPGMSWVGPNSRWFEDPSRWDVFLAEDGPSSWQRIEVAVPDEGDKPIEAAPPSDDPEWSRLELVEQPEARPVPAIEVSAVEVGRDGVSFDVSEVGVPVLVRMSYFPNWQASGADGPYRVSPNLMVVIPTDTHVELTYGWTAVDAGSYALTALGIAGAVLLARFPRRAIDDRLLLDGPEPDVDLDERDDDWDDDELDERDDPADELGDRDDELDDRDDPDGDGDPDGWRRFAPPDDS